MALKTISGLWLSEKGHLSAKTRDEIVIPAGTTFFVFKNKKRDKENSPTHTLCIAVDDEQQEIPSRQVHEDDNEPF